MHHEAPQAISRLTLRAIGLANTRSSINGHIKDYEGAIKTDSEQHMASLLLSAKAAAQPSLVQALTPLIGAIGIDRMRQANYMVDRGENRKTVAQAADWLNANRLHKHDGQRSKVTERSRL